MKYSSYIFDLDGTILNTLDDLADAVRFALAKNGLPERTTDEVCGFVGNGMKKLIERSTNYASDELQSKVFCDFSEYYKLHCCDRTKPYDGIAELLIDLKNSGACLAVVSNKDDYAVKSLCEHYFPGIFSVMLGAKAGARRKPFPDGVLEAIRLMNASLDTACFVGDSDVDIRTAENAGIPCISVLWGFRSRQFLTDNGAKILVDTPDMIKNI